LEAKGKVNEKVTYRIVNSKAGNQMKKNLIVSISAIVGIILVCYFCFGLFIIQPLGMLPEGATVVYFRLGLNLPFISSADGLILKKSKDVSLLERGLMMATLSKPIIERKIVTLPYFNTLYLVSTGGVEFEK
jgi:hypothetical protein